MIERKIVVGCFCALLALAMAPFSVSAASYGGQVDGVGDVKVELLEKGNPVFPRRARSYGISGEVVIRFNIDTEGNAASPVIVESKPRRMFDRSAMRYMQTLKFSPYMDGGSPVVVKDVLITVSYVLAEG